MLLTREPGGAPRAEALRTLLLTGGIDWSPDAEALLHVAARVEHVARTIRPALADGITVICDRYADSTMAYQGWGQGADRAMLEAVARAATPLLPDLTLLLDVPEAIGAARIAARGTGRDRYEQLGPDFHARVRAGFHAIAAAAPERCVIIDASAEPGVVHAAIMDVIDAREAQ